MKSIREWYGGISRRVKSSCAISVAVVGMISSVMSIIGVTINEWTKDAWLSIGILIVLMAFVFLIAFLIIGMAFKDSVYLFVRKTNVNIIYGNIFNVDGFRVIGCDTHFNTRVDDGVISKKSLHGQFILEHGDTKEIQSLVREEAQKRELAVNEDGLYEFPLGTIIRYDSSRDGKTYLMLAMMELDDNNMAHTNMAKYETMLMKMWTEIDRIYASNSVVLPLLGTGISRFDDGPKDKESLLRCMLCTLNASGVSLNSKVTIVVANESKDMSFYELKDMFKTFQGK